MDKLCESLLARRHKSAGEMQDGVIDDLMEFIGDSKIHDDISIVVIKHE
jgi:serine phosphatase RsbU (regulator of sigma subunit)